MQRVDQDWEYVCMKFEVPVDIQVEVFSARLYMPTKFMGKV